jgi:hypothetical protein
MEESGHYYTVYFTSLAVGFDEQTAYRHAVLAQMPDEVGALDAGEMHEDYCFGLDYVDLDGNRRAVPGAELAKTEYALHSLVNANASDKSAARQRQLTRKLLDDADVYSLEFGLLLHRLGDSYAHSVIFNEDEMYTVSSSGAWLECLNPVNVGHGWHFHFPDYPFFRTQLFYDYLDDLYSALQVKYQQQFAWVDAGNRSYSVRTNVLSESQLKNIFESILGAKLGQVNLSIVIEVAGAYFNRIPNFEDTQLVFIQQIREKCLQELGITMQPYSPELQGPRKLTDFLQDHHELDTMEINSSKVRNAIENIKKGLDQ